MVPIIRVRFPVATPTEGSVEISPFGLVFVRTVMGKNSSYDIRKSNLELLLASPNFKKVVFAFRKKWGIPKDGLTNKTASKWWDNHIKQSDQAISANQDDKDIPLKSFNIEAEALAKSSDVLKVDRDVFRRFLLYDKINWMPTANAKLTYEINKETKERKAIIESHPSTTLKDIEKLWPIVKGIQENVEGYKPRRMRTVADPETVKQVLRLKEQGLSSREIAQKVKDKFPGRTIVYKDINRILQDIKKRTNPT